MSERFEMNQTDSDKKLHYKVEENYQRMAALCIAIGADEEKDVHLWHYQGEEWIYLSSHTPEVGDITCSNSNFNGEPPHKKLIEKGLEIKC